MRIKTVLLTISLLVIFMAGFSQSKIFSGEVDLAGTKKNWNKKKILQSIYIYYVDTITKKIEVKAAIDKHNKFNIAIDSAYITRGKIGFYSAHGIDSAFSLSEWNNPRTIKLRINMDSIGYFNPYYHTPAEKATLSGIVMDEKGEAAIGAPVKIKSTKIGTITDFNGRFSISDLKSGLYPLEISYMGFETQIIPVLLFGDTNINIKLIENKENIKEIEVTAYKPAIYLYPTQEQKTTIQLDFKGQLGTTYPKYNQGWNVIAKPNGEILNLTDNRKYTYLFWEGAAKFPESHFDYKNGFVVAKNELDKFLLEKLSYIGLNNTEINDFIVYWLPQMEKNEYNLVHFFINDNIDNSAFLNVNPKPDTEIRIFMEFKAVDKSFQIKEQILPKIERKGFTLVEWGGGIIGKNRIE